MTAKATYPYGQVDVATTTTQHLGEIALYEDLLDAAHRLGLCRIHTKLLQTPTDANDNTAIVHATVQLPDDRQFQALGDANPTNVNKKIRPHLIRMAETRAKARALRDATNSTAPASDDADLQQDTTTAEPTPPPTRTPTPTTTTNQQPEATATDDQLELLAQLLHETEIPPWWDGALTVTQATSAITALNAIAGDDEAAANKAHNWIARIRAQNPPAPPPAVVPAQGRPRGNGATAHKPQPTAPDQTDELPPFDDYPF